MAAETGFLIDGTVYEVPTLDSLTMGERRTMFELSGMTQEDFVRGEDESELEYDERVEGMTRHPGFMEALMRVAYQRANPTVKAAKVSLVIDKTNFLDAVATMTADDEPEEDAVPLGLTTPPDNPSPSEPSSSNVSTEPASDTPGTDLTIGSDPLAVPPTPIGTMRSATSSPESPPTESVA